MKTGWPFRWWRLGFLENHAILRENQEHPCFIREAKSTAPHTRTSRASAIRINCARVVCGFASWVCCVAGAQTGTPTDGTVDYCRHNAATDLTTVSFANLKGGADTLITTGWMAHNTRKKDEAGPGLPAPRSNGGPESGATRAKTQRRAGKRKSALQKIASVVPW